MKSTKIK